MRRLRSVTAAKGFAEPARSIDRRLPLADLPEFLTVDEFGAYVGLSRNTVYDLVRRHEIHHVKFGSQIRIPRAALQRLAAGEREQEC